MGEQIYPQPLEDRIIDFIFSRRFNSVVDINYLIKCVQVTSDKLTVYRDSLNSSNYYSHTMFRNGYLFYIFPRSFSKVYIILSELLELNAINFSERKILRIGDFGCGPGSAFLAAYYFVIKNRDRFSNLKTLEVTAVDYKTDLIEFGKSLFGAIREFEKSGIDLHIKSVKADFNQMHTGEPLKDRFDIVFMVNILNELFRYGEQEKKETLMKRISGRNLTKEGILVIVEPAMRLTSIDIMRLKNMFEEQGWYIIAPCLPVKGECPYLTYRGDREWCHFKASYKPPVLLKECAEILKRDAKKTLKWSYLILSKKNKNVFLNFEDLDEGGRNLMGRCISDTIEEKGKRGFFLCCGDSVKKVEILKRHLKNTELKNMKFRRGDIVSLKNFKTTGKIVRIDKPDNINILWRR